jgi:hypothetical protein
VALAPAARRVPSGLFLFGSAVVILLAGVLAGLLPAKLARHDASGRADDDVDRWFAGHRTSDSNRATTTPLRPRGRGPDPGRAVARVPGHALPADVLAGALWGTGWLVVTVRGIRLGVRHREFRAETAGEDPANPARRWPRPRHG